VTVRELFTIAKLLGFIAECAEAFMDVFIATTVTAALIAPAG
jgi:hypothetical protein